MAKKKYSYFHILIIFVLCGIVAWTASIRHSVPPSVGYGVNQITESQILAVAPNQITLATFNIQSGKGLDDTENLYRTSTVLKNAEIVALNEVSGNANEFSINPKNQAQLLAEMLDNGWLFMPFQQRWYRPYFGNGLLTKFKTNAWSSYPLTAEIYNYQDPENNVKHNIYKTQRNLSVFHIPYNADKEFVLLVTHLTREDGVQNEQLKEVITEFKRYPRAVLMGDLNVSKTDPQIKELLSNNAYIDAIGKTIKDEDDDDRVDWIITTSNIKSLSGGFEPEGVSDHPYYWVKISL